MGKPDAGQLVGKKLMKDCCLTGQHTSSSYGGCSGVTGV
jgi:hypothetical protein